MSYHTHAKTLHYSTSHLVLLGKVVKVNLTAVTNYKSKAELKGFRLKMKAGKVNADYAC